VVKKDQSGSITESSVIELDKDARIREIARMLAGQEDSTTAHQHAAELLNMVAESVIS
jgi:DNA repair protein RecN (Recombination protein N)